MRVKHSVIIKNLIDGVNVVEIAKIKALITKHLRVLKELHRFLSCKFLSSSLIFLLDGLAYRSLQL